jgi:hypothetical protein
MMGSPNIIKIKYVSKRGTLGGCLIPKGSPECAKCFWNERGFDRPFTLDLPEPVYAALGTMVSTFSGLLGDPDEHKAPTDDQVAWGGILMALDGASNERMATLRPFYELAGKLRIKLTPPDARFHISLGPYDVAQLAQVAYVFRKALVEVSQISILTLLFRRIGLVDFLKAMDLLTRALEAAAPKCYLRPIPTDSTISGPAIYS